MNSNRIIYIATKLTASKLLRLSFQHIMTIKQLADCQMMLLRSLAAYPPGGLKGSNYFMLQFVLFLLITKQVKMLMRREMFSIE